MVVKEGEGGASANQNPVAQKEEVYFILTRREIGSDCKELLGVVKADYHSVTFPDLGIVIQIQLNLPDSSCFFVLSLGPIKGC
jgi:hypothetical protein